MCSVLFRGNVCIWSDKISNVSAILGQKSAARLKKSEPKHEVATIERDLKFRKRVVQWDSMRLANQRAVFLEWTNQRAGYGPRDKVGREGISGSWDRV